MKTQAKPSQAIDRDAIKESFIHKIVLQKKALHLEDRTPQIQTQKMVNVFHNRFKIGHLPERIHEVEEWFNVPLVRKRSKDKSNTRKFNSLIPFQVFALNMYEFPCG